MTQWPAPSRALVVHGRAGPGQSSAARQRTHSHSDSAVPPGRLDEGVAPLAVLKALEPHGQAEKGGPGTPGAGHGPPTSWCTGAHGAPAVRPRSASCPLGSRPAREPGSCALTQGGCWTHAGARGPGRVRSRFGGGAEADPLPELLSPEPRACEAARRGQGKGENKARLEEGGDWRREREEAEGRRRDPGWVEGAPRWGARAAASRAPGLRSGALAFSSQPPSLRRVRGARRLGDLRTEGGCRQVEGSGAKEPGRGWRVRGHQAGCVSCGLRG